MTQKHITPHLPAYEPFRTSLPSPLLDGIDFLSTDTVHYCKPIAAGFKVSALRKMVVVLVNCNLPMSDG